VSCFCACIGSPCLRHCVHGASIGGGQQSRTLGDRGQLAREASQRMAVLSAGGRSQVRRSL
jgi:hypothetical protein